jgi:hypothetical protein
MRHEYGLRHLAGNKSFRKRTRLRLKTNDGNIVNTTSHALNQTADRKPGRAEMLGGWCSEIVRSIYSWIVLNLHFSYTLIIVSV